MTKPRSFPVFTQMNEGAPQHAFVFPRRRIALDVFAQVRHYLCQHLTSGLASKIVHCLQKPHPHLRLRRATQTLLGLSSSRRDRTTHATQAGSPQAEVAGNRYSLHTLHRASHPMRIHEMVEFFGPELFEWPRCH